MTPEIIMTATAIVLAYAALANRLFVFGRSTRDDFIDAAERLALDPRVSDEHRTAIWHVGMRFTSATISWRAVVLLIYAISRNAARRISGTPRRPAPQPMVQIETIPPDLAAEYRRIIKASVMALLCNSPAALLTFSLIIGFASFASSGFGLVETVASQLGNEARRPGGDVCPPSRVA